MSIQFAMKYLVFKLSRYETSLAVSPTEVLVQASGRWVATGLAHNALVRYIGHWSPHLRSCQKLPLGCCTACWVTASHNIVSAPSSTVRSREPILNTQEKHILRLYTNLLWKSGIAVLTAGVSAQPGCMTEKWTAGCWAAQCSVSTTCCLLFCAYAIVPSYGSICSDWGSSAVSFCTSIPPEETVTTLHARQTNERQSQLLCRPSG